MDITQAASLLIPGTSWNYDGEKLIQADDGTPRVKVPSMKDLQPIIDGNLYIEQRAAEYPSIADQLDAIWKGGDDFDAMEKKISDIKNKYPKTKGKG